MTARGQARDTRLLRRVRWRLVAWSAGSTLVLLVGLGLVLYVSVNASLQATGATQLEQRAETLTAIVTDEPPGAPPVADPGPFGRAIFGGPASGTLAIVVDRAGTIVGPSPAGITSLPIGDAVEAALRDGRDLRETSLGETPIRVLSESVSVSGESYVVQIIQDRSAEVRTLNTLVTVLVLGGLAVLAAAAGFGFLYAGRALVPIRESLRHQREFTADASHELRTPITVLQTSLEYLRRHPERRVSDTPDVIDGMEGEVRHLAGLVDDLLLLARTDSGVLQISSERVDLAETAGEALQSLRALAEQRDTRLRFEAAPTAVAGDPLRLRQLVAILVDNAIQHSPAGGTVLVTVSSDGAGATVSVEDQGAGIRDKDLANLFDRFWRAQDAPPGGTGLGLSIAKWVAEAHGGSLSARNRPSGGARFDLRLPGLP
jgi:two-component system sensor histidine kinase CiaH